MVEPSIPEGASREQTFHTTPGMGVKHVGPIEMLSTPSMIGFMEQTSMGLLSQYLEKPTTSVGSRVDVRHLAPAPVGEEVRVTASFIRAEGRRYLFAVAAHVGSLKIGDGTHERAVVDPSRFNARA